MRPDDRQAFKALLTDAMAFYRQDISSFALSVWWQACERYDFEQVSKAITAHAMDPERGQFAPKPADVVRQLQGTNTDRSLIAWGKVFEAMQLVGSYQTVAFDDPVIHAVIDDMGGWPRICVTEADELPFVQRRFCETYRAYANRPSVSYPSKLIGLTEQANGSRYQAAAPVLIGEPAKAQAVIANGSQGPRTQINQIGASLPLRIEGKAA